MASAKVISSNSISNSLSKIIVISLDESTDMEYGSVFRSKHAKLLSEVHQVLDSSSPLIVGYDIDFRYKSGNQKEVDLLFESILSANIPTVFAVPNNLTRSEKDRLILSSHPELNHVLIKGKKHSNGVWLSPESLVVESCVNNAQLSGEIPFIFQIAQVLGVNPTNLSKICNTVLDERLITKINAQEVVKEGFDAKEYFSNKIIFIGSDYKQLDIFSSFYGQINGVFVHAIALAALLEYSKEKNLKIIEQAQTKPILKL